MSSFEECDHVLRWTIDVAHLVHERKVASLKDHSQHQSTTLNGAYSYYANCLHQSSSSVGRARALGLETMIRCDEAFLKEFQRDSLSVFQMLLDSFPTAAGNDNNNNNNQPHAVPDCFQVSTSSSSSSSASAGLQAASSGSSFSADNTKQSAATTIEPLPAESRFPTLASALTGGNGFVFDDAHLPDSRGTLSCAVYVWKERRCARLFHRIMQTCINEAAELMLPPPFHAAGILCSRVSYGESECSVLLLPPVASVRPTCTASSLDPLARPLREPEEGCGYFALRTFAAALSPLLLPKSASLSAGEQGGSNRITIASYACSGNEALVLPRSVASVAQFIEDPSPSELPADDRAKLSKRQKLLLVRPELQTELEACGDDSQKISQLLDRSLRAVALDLVTSFVATCAQQQNQQTSASKQQHQTHLENSLELSGDIGTSHPTIATSAGAHPQDNHQQYEALSSVANVAVQRGQVAQTMHEHGMNMRLLYLLKCHLESLACERPLDAPVIKLVTVAVGAEMVMRSLKQLVRRKMTSSASGTTATTSSPPTSPTSKLSAARKKGLSTMLLNKAKKIQSNEEANPLDDPDFDENNTAGNDNVSNNNDNDKSNSGANNNDISVELQSIFDLFVDDRIYYREVILPTMRNKFRCPEGFFVDRDSISSCVGGVAVALAQSFACGLSKDMKTFTKQPSPRVSDVVCLLPRLRQTFLSHLLHTCSHTYLSSSNAAAISSPASPNANTSGAPDGATSQQSPTTPPHQSSRHAHMSQDTTTSHDTFLRSGNVLPTTTLSQLTSGLSPRGPSPFNETARILKFSFSEFMRHCSKSQQERETDASVSSPRHATTDGAGQPQYLESARSVVFKQVAQRIRRTGVGRSTSSFVSSSSALSPSSSLSFSASTGDMSSTSSTHNNNNNNRSSSRPSSAGDARIKRFLSVWLLCCAAGTMPSDVRAAICRGVVSEFVVVFRLTSRSCFEASSALLAAVYALRQFTTDFSMMPQRERAEIVGVAPDLLLFAANLGTQLVHEWHDPFFFCPTTTRFVTESLPYQLLLSMSPSAASSSSRSDQQQVINVSHSFFQFMETCSKIFDTAEARDGIGKDAAVHVISGLAAFYNNVLVWNLRAGTEVRPQDGYMDLRSRSPLGSRPPTFDDSPCWAIGIDIVLLQPLFKLKLSQLVKRSTKGGFASELRAGVTGAAATPSPFRNGDDSGGQHQEISRISTVYSTTSNTVDNNSGILADDEQSFMSAASSAASSPTRRSAAANWWLDVLLFSLSTVYPQLANAALQSNTTFDPVVSATSDPGQQTKTPPSTATATTTLCDEFLMRCLLILVGFFADSGSIHGDLVVLASQLDRHAAKVLPAMLTANNKEVSSGDISEMIQRINKSLNDSGADENVSAFLNQSSNGDESNHKKFDSPHSPSRMSTRFQTTSVFSPANDTRGTIVTSGVTSEPQRAVLSEALRIALTTAAHLPELNAARVTRFAAPVMMSSSSSSKTRPSSSSASPSSTSRQRTTTSTTTTTTSGSSPSTTRTAGGQQQTASSPLSSRAELPSSKQQRSDPSLDNDAARLSIQKKMLYLLFKHVGTLLHSLPLNMTDMGESLLALWQYWVHHLRRGTARDHLPPFDMSEWRRYSKARSLAARGCTEDEVSDRMIAESEARIAFKALMVGEAEARTKIDARQNAQAQSQEQEYAVLRIQSAQRQRAAHEKFVRRSSSREQLMSSPEVRRNGPEEQRYAALKIQCLSRQKASRNRIAALRDVRSSSRQPHVLQMDEEVDRQELELEEHIAYMELRRSYRNNNHSSSNDERIITTSDDEEFILAAAANKNDSHHEAQRQEQTEEHHQQQQQQQQQQQEDEEERAAATATASSPPAPDDKAALKIQSLQRQRMARQKVADARALRSNAASFVATSITAALSDDLTVLSHEESLTRLDIEQDEACNFGGLRRAQKLLLAPQVVSEWKELVAKDERGDASDVDEDDDDEDHDGVGDEGGDDAEQSRRAAVKIQSARRQRAARLKVDRLRALKRDFAQDRDLLLAEERLARSEEEQTESCEFAGVRRLAILLRSSKQTATGSNGSDSDADDDRNNQEEQHNQQHAAVKIQSLQRQRQAKAAVANRRHVAADNAKSLAMLCEYEELGRNEVDNDQMTGFAAIRVLRKVATQQEARAVTRTDSDKDDDDQTTKTQQQEQRDNSPVSSSSSSAHVAIPKLDLSSANTGNTTAVFQQEKEEHNKQDTTTSDSNDAIIQKELQRLEALREAERRHDAELLVQNHQRRSAPSSRPTSAASQHSSPSMSPSARGGAITMVASNPPTADVLELDELEIEMRFSLETCERRMRRMFRLPQ